jgi:HSP20 family protein
MLRISMTREGMTKEETDSFRRIERFHGHMSRIITLPDNVDANAVDATVTDGVLHVMIPKKEGEKEKKIQIK